MKASKKSTPVRAPLKGQKNRKIEVYSNLAISLDGKIATHDRAFFTLGSAQDLRLLRKLRNQADVIFFGSGVLRAFRRACLPLRSNKKTVNAVVSRNFSNVDP
jgi:riboflavin biosynthesis pyrimidine reductase